MSKLLATKIPLSHCGCARDFWGSVSKEWTHNPKKKLDTETGRKKFGPSWKGSGGYAQADAFVIHFAQHCCDARNSKKVRAKLKEIIVPAII